MRERGYGPQLDTTPPRLTFAGTIVYVKGRGYHRRPWTKSDAGYRTRSR